jgi:hypothetical protein
MDTCLVLGSLGNEKKRARKTNVAWNLVLDNKFIDEFSLEVSDSASQKGNYFGFVLTAQKRRTRMRDFSGSELKSASSWHIVNNTEFSKGSKNNVHAFFALVLRRGEK